MKSKSKLKRKRAKARHQKSRYFVGGFKPLPDWGKLTTIIGMTLVSGLFLLVSVSAYFADYTGITLGFNIPTYYFTVDYNSNGGSSVDSAEYKFGESLIAPVQPTKSGAEFAGWYAQEDLSGAAWDFEVDTMPKADLDLYAKWETGEYNINYVLDGGTNTDLNPATYTYGTGVYKFAIPSKTGYTFVNWYDAPTDGNVVLDISTEDQGDKTLYARWQADEYKITYNLYMGSYGNNPTTYTYGTGVASFAPATGSAGYDFVGWYDAAPGGSPVTSISPTATGDKNLYARWTAKTFNITYNLGGGTNGSNPATYNYGTGVASFAPATRTNFKFTGWYDAPTGGNLVTSIPTNATGVKALYAQWVAAYTITFKNFVGTSDVLDSQVIEAGGTLTIPDAPKANEYFLGWAESASSRKSATLYVPETYTDVRLGLNNLDKTYLGYNVKPAHALTNINASKTLYAVYYKQLKATSKASTSGEYQEFIWNNAIWRVVNTRDDGPLRLVLKYSALTGAEVFGLGFNTENDRFSSYKEVMSDDFDAKIHFHSQDGEEDIEDELYFYNSNTDDGYNRSRVKSIIDAYYNQLEDTEAVQPVYLNMPRYANFRVNKSFYAAGYNSWGWTDYALFLAYGEYQTTIEATGDKQAFALSMGDVNKAVGYTRDTNAKSLLDFGPSYWLRSPGERANSVIFVGVFGLLNEEVRYNELSLVWNVHSIRPAMYLSVE